MQSINVILVAAVATFGLPLVMLAFSSYSLYNTISMARYAKRRNENLFKAVDMARKTLKNLD